MAGRFSILAFLLLSLCISRGEGLHLLPFADEPTEPTVVEPTRRSATYQYSVDPQNASALKHSKKKNAADIQGLSDLSSFLPGWAASISVPFAAPSKVRFLARTKFELTASSDRSPPFRVIQ